jgi:hypothetical protein
MFFPPRHCCRLKSVGSEKNGPLLFYVWEPWQNKGAGEALTIAAHLEGGGLLRKLIIKSFLALVIAGWALCLVDS